MGNLKIKNWKRIKKNYLIPKKGGTAYSGETDEEKEKFRKMTNSGL